MAWDGCGPTRSVRAARARADESQTWVPANAAHKPPIRRVDSMSRPAKHAGRREVAAGLVDDSGEDVRSAAVGDRLDAEPADRDLARPVGPSELVAGRKME